MTINDLEGLLKRIDFYQNPKRVYRDISLIGEIERERLKANIKEGAEQEETPSLFLRRHDLVWEGHNEFDAELTHRWRTLPLLTRTPLGQETLLSLLSTSNRLDRAKRIVANIIKPVIEGYASKQHLSVEEERALLTGLTESFYVQYARDVGQEDIGFLAGKYFRGNPNLARFTIGREKPKMPKSLPPLLDRIQLHRKILLHEKTLLAQRLGNEVFSVDQLLERDHFQEYVYRKSLIGVGDYFLHQIASEFTKTPIEGFDEGVIALQQRVGLNEGEFEYPLPLFYQTGFRCAISSLLNGVSSILGGLPTRENEQMFGDKIIALPGETTATLPNLLAQVALEDFGLDSTLIFEDEDFFSNSKGAVKKDYFTRYVSQFKETLPHSRDIGVGLDFESFYPESMVKRLRIGPVVIATWQQEITHYNLLFGYNLQERVFSTFDPLIGPKKVSFDQFPIYCNTPFGRWAVAISPNLRGLEQIGEEFQVREEKLGREIPYLNLPSEELSE